MTSENMQTSAGVIVVVEDSPPNRTILVHLVKKLGFEVIDCKDGQYAYDEIKKLTDGGTKILAVLSDIMMPRVDGLQLLRKLRESENTKAIPFVLVTAVSDKNHIMEAKNLDAQGYILKPVTVQRVLSKLKELFPERKFPQLAS